MHQKTETSNKQAKTTVLKASTAKKTSNYRTPWEIASKLVADIPEEAWDKVPSDLSITVDHYLIWSAEARNLISD